LVRDAEGKRALLGIAQHYELLAGRARRRIDERDSGKAAAASDRLALLVINPPN